MAKLIYPDKSYAIMGACFNVYKDKGCGFTEPIYQECMEIEFEHQNLPSRAQPRMKLKYRGRELKKIFKPDFICYNNFICGHVKKRFSFFRVFSVFRGLK